ncbi:hypothetical protein [Roseisolibacter sp. H3M3-2]|uniref:hypothetical protein n=1 Tax=Roseisolibacter sp. H3M3-2 TaxID=3031323 RepID=UPI0023DBF789|nr:hypothetical protein [Roseisolibacter sp. H3M3-2]MDF1503621.1 hypothetical protein [Roseisolibacter sp. H3M3-2]
MLALIGVTAILVTSYRYLARGGAGGPGGGRLGPDAAVTRGGRRLAAIERVTRSRGRGRLPLYLAPAAGPVIDSARVGALAARLLPSAGGNAAPVIALVPRDSVRGQSLVGRLVVTPGEPGLLVFGAPGDRP